VLSADHLQDVVMESLARLEQKLQGEKAAVVGLWDRIERGSYRPKDEKHLSAYVAGHLGGDLRERGIVVNCEVQIRLGEKAGQGGKTGQGEETDIHVDAVIHQKDGTPDIVTVIIEAKGCWHPDLDTAMETQLVGRYLKDNQCRHGIYLVGWYKCPQWTACPPRQEDAPQETMEDVRHRLEQQAVGLSEGGKRIRAFVLNTALRS